MVEVRNRETGVVCKAESYTNYTRYGISQELSEEGYLVDGDFYDEWKFWDLFEPVEPQHEFLRRAIGPGKEVVA